MLKITAQSTEVLQALRSLQRRLGSLLPAMEAIGQTMESRISGRFETESDPNGQSWAPWAPSTRVGYPEDGNGRVLDRYGDMLLSLSSQATADSVSIGFGQAYAAFHEFGTSNMPRRGLLSADPDTGQLGAADSAAIEELLADFLNEFR